MTYIDVSTEGFAVVIERRNRADELICI